MRITLAVALVGILSSSVLAQESVQVETEANIEAPSIVVDSYIELADGEVAEGEVAAGSVLESESSNSVEPVLYQEGIVVEGAVPGVTEGSIEGALVTEPSSVISGEVIQSDPVYTEGVPRVEGSVVTEGGGVMSGQPVAATPNCGCGSSDAVAAMTYASAPAPVMTYSSAPVPYSAPASSPCCDQPRRGFFRSLFGN